MPNRSDRRRSYAYFGVRGDFDPAALAFEMGLIPSRCVRQYSKDLGRKLPRCSLLRFAETDGRGDGGASDDIYDLAEAVIAPLIGQSDAIAAALRDRAASACLQIVLYLPESDGGQASLPAFGFASAVVRFLADVGASIDVDSYWA